MSSAPSSSATVLTPAEVLARAAFESMSASNPPPGELSLAWPLQLACMALLGGEPLKVVEVLQHVALEPVPAAQEDWLQFARECAWASWAAVLRCTARDLATPPEMAQRLRELQSQHEGVFLAAIEGRQQARDAAYELMALYFTVTAAERMAQWLTEPALGPADIGAQVRELLERAARCISRVSSGPTKELVPLLVHASRRLCLA